MKREGREVWEQRVRRLEESGLTMKEFAEELGVNVHTLNGWKWKLASEARLKASLRTAVTPASFVEVTATTRHEEHSAADIEVERFELVLRSGVRVRIPLRFESAALRQLVTALEGC
jgi:hypothetical protein